MGFRVSSGEQLRVVGDVYVWQSRNGVRFNKQLVHDVTGTSLRVSASEAVKNMRSQAKIIYRNRTEIPYPTPLFTSVLSYDVKKRDVPNTKRQRFRRRGKYYFVVRGADGRFITSGRWSSREVDVESAVEVSEDE
jgi:hypothetical protein